MFCFNSFVSYGLFFSFSPYLSKCLYLYSSLFLTISGFFQYLLLLLSLFFLPFYHHFQLVSLFSSFIIHLCLLSFLTFLIIHLYMLPVSPISCETYFCLSLLIFVIPPFILVSSCLLTYAPVRALHTFLIRYLHVLSCTPVFSAVTLYISIFFSYVFCISSFILSVSCCYSPVLDLHTCFITQHLCFLHIRQRHLMHLCLLSVPSFSPPPSFVHLCLPLSTFHAHVSSPPLFVDMPFPSLPYLPFWLTCSSLLFLLLVLFCPPLSTCFPHLAFPGRFLQGRKKGGGKGEAKGR